MSTLPIVIIVEPDSMVSDVLRVEFSCLGCAVLMAATGEQAEEYAARTVANLVVLDVTTMKLQGYAACARIRRQAGYANRPIVLTSRTVSAQDTMAGEKAGASLILAKPYSMTELVQAVAPHLPAGDPLLTHPSRPGGMAEAVQEWKPMAKPAWRFGADSGLSRNQSILSVVRAEGKKVPLIRPA
jgi:DNA-binding response OmpR family regulator